MRGGYIWHHQNNVMLEAPLVWTLFIRDLYSILSGGNTLLANRDFSNLNHRFPIKFTSKITGEKKICLPIYLEHFLSKMDQGFYIKSRHGNQF